MSPINSHQVMIWGNPNQSGAAYDFRSDVVTTPSRGMLAAIAHATLNDDVYNEDETTRAFEKEMATRCGHEAGAFVLSGTMANQLALRTLLFQPPYAVLTDVHSHVIHWEAGGVSFLSGAAVQAVRPRNGKHLTLNDIQKHAVVTDDVHKCPTRVISLENTTAGHVIPLSDLQAIKKWADEHDILVHLDGARLWEAVSTGAGSLRDFAQCAHLATLDFSKNLAAPMGAMVVGSGRRIQSLKRIRKGIGGGMRQAGILAAAAHQAVNENFGEGVLCTRPQLARSHELARQIAASWQGRGGRLLRDVETNMVWVDLASAGVRVEQWKTAGEEHGIRLDGTRIVTHHQICDSAVSSLQRVMDEVVGWMAREPNARQVVAAKL
ncbi:threonine aldolase [Microdochium nivale]|nr:threonine aldolase [Microdochium nivale]